MQTQPAELQTLVQNNSNDRLAIIMAYQLQQVTFKELEIELRRLDLVLNRLLTEWSADNKVLVPILMEDLVWDGSLIVSEIQAN